MAIPNGTRFIGISQKVDLTERKSTYLNSLTEPYTIEDIYSRDVIELDLQGTTNASTSQASYGINLITTSTATDLATRLPEPKTGRSTVFINNSSMPILVFPSVVGGEINGVVDGSATIPNDGKAYEFFCVRNPLPGAWIWSPPAVQQYDSGEITVDTTLGSVSIFSALDPTKAEEVGQFLSSATWAQYGPQMPTISLQPLLTNNSWVLIPTNPWNAITKVKVYTNVSSAMQFRIAAANSETFFDLSGNYVSTGATTAAQYATSGGVIDGSTSLIVPGATLPPATLTTNIGDAGSRYGELIYPAGSGISSAGQIRSEVGVIDEGIVGGQQKYYTNAISFQLKTNAPAGNYTGLKFRFFIEYA